MTSLWVNWGPILQVPSNSGQTVRRSETGETKEERCNRRGVTSTVKLGKFRLEDVEFEVSSEDGPALGLVSD